MKKTKLRHYTFDQIAYKYEDISNVVLSSMRRHQLNNTDFSIVSNNCWGGHVYRRYGLPYSSPTVGMYFFAEEYIKFLSNLSGNIPGKLSFISPRESKYSSELIRKKQTEVPIGLINDQIEVVFLHYHSREEAYEKWMRRSERFNFNNMIVKFSQMNLCTNEHILLFDRMTFAKKILLLAEPITGVQGIIVKKYANENEVTDDTTYYASHIPLKTIINA